MTPAEQLAQLLAAEQKLGAAFADACKAEHNRMQELSERLSHTSPADPQFRELLRELSLSETAVRYLPAAQQRSEYRQQNLRRAATRL